MYFGRGQGWVSHVVKNCVRHCFCTLEHCCTLEQSPNPALSISSVILAPATGLTLPPFYQETNMWYIHLLANQHFQSTINIWSEKVYPWNIRMCREAFQCSNDLEFQRCEGRLFPLLGFQKFLTAMFRKEFCANGRKIWLEQWHVQVQRSVGADRK